MLDNLQKKTLKANLRIGSDALLSGEFGESFVAYLLSKNDIEVVKVNTVGFDLFAIDSAEKIFPRNEIVGISVKTRV